jgi:hypothetical protein
MYAYNYLNLPLYMKHMRVLIIQMLIVSLKNKTSVLRKMLQTSSFLLLLLYNNIFRNIMYMHIQIICTLHNC